MKENEKQKKVKHWLIEKGISIIPVVFIMFFFTVKILSNQSELMLNIINHSKLFLNKIFCQETINSLGTISAILIGFNVTIMSVFGTSYSQAVVTISDKKLTSTFTSYAKMSLWSSFIFFLATIFHETVFSFSFSIFIYTFIFLWVLTSFVRFAIIVLRMYEVNIENTSKSSKEKKEESHEITIILREIREQLKNEKNLSDDDYFQNIKKMSDDQRKE
ncbi:hypothetical protein RH915_05900 [Serpentinicella sp. ANB-PHB4]|uniref:hypothetical protein n=1 Tax=Serpentinicella sp. ANB-PHB4 TaxID=3074076 RepID=UPI002854CC48|nr:hypothetical protein [Serpentinicella sp. ANB-PHB4]MDR5659016.1 hypothetical protein [Serpentinicella sp. ANB-PHB4]